MKTWRDTEEGRGGEGLAGSEPRGIGGGEKRQSLDRATRVRAAQPQPCPSAAWREEMVSFRSPHLEGRWVWGGFVLERDTDANEEGEEGWLALPASREGALPPGKAGQRASRRRRTPTAWDSRRVLGFQRSQGGSAHDPVRVLSASRVHTCVCVCLAWASLQKGGRGTRPPHTHLHTCGGTLAGAASSQVPTTPGPGEVLNLTPWDPDARARRPLGAKMSAADKDPEAEGSMQPHLLT